MIIKTPAKYISGYDVLKDAGKHIAEYSKNPFIIGSRSALEATGGKLKKTLDENGISTEYIEIFQGYPSENQFQHYVNAVKETNTDAIIAVGGGRVLDTAKAAADLLDIPVITIPTIAATCAAWAGLTIQYDDEGSFVKARPLKKSPVLIIADTEIIFSAPERYLFAGAADTFAKFYEIRPSLEQAKDSINLDIAFYASKIAFQKLEENVFKALEEAKKNIYAQAAKDVVDSIIYLAGFAGSFQTNTGYYSFAHPFYHISARFPKTRHKLHGEKVAYGILAQLLLENKPENEIVDAVHLFEKYHNAFTLEEIGFDRENKEELGKLADTVKNEFPYVIWSRDDIVWALLHADDAVKNIRSK